MFRLIPTGASILTMAVVTKQTVGATVGGPVSARPAPTPPTVTAGRATVIDS